MLKDFFMEGNNLCDTYSYFFKAYKSIFELNLVKNYYFKATDT